MKDRLLDNVIIAAPCPVSWESMQGTDTVRHCTQCSKSVYNLSAMSDGEAETFLQENGTSQCARFYRRPDGRIMTDNCPAGLRRLHQKYASLVAAISGLVFSMFGQTAQSQNQKPYPNPAGGISFQPTMGKPMMNPTAPTTPKTDGTCIDPTKIEVPKNGDATAINFYNMARTNEAAGRDAVAFAYYKQALDTARSQKASDPKFIKKISKDLEKLRKRMQSNH